VGRMIRKSEGRLAFEQGVRSLDGLTAKVGWFESAKYTNGTPVAYVAAIQEFGAAAQGIPPRPFMRPTYKAESKKWKDQIAKGATRVLQGRMSANQVMEQVANGARGDVDKTIAALTAPALKQSTIDARLRKKRDGKTVGGLTKPLEDSGLMRETLSYEVTPA
jgi:phage gpG-like protein